CFAGQNQKCRLEGVVRVVRVGQDGAAQAQHHRRVPLHQRLERRLFLTRDEPLQELPVRQGRVGFRADELPDMPKDRTQLSAGHLPTPKDTFLSLRSLSAGGPASNFRNSPALPRESKQAFTRLFTELHVRRTYDEPEASGCRGFTMNNPFLIGSKIYL